MLSQANSMSLALALAEPMVMLAWVEPDLNKRAFVKFDRAMLELCAERGWTEGCEEENLEKWRSLRKQVLDNHRVDLAEITGNLPTWKYPKGPWGLRRVLAGLGIDRVRVSYVSFHVMFLPAMC